MNMMTSWVGMDHTAIYGSYFRQMNDYENDNIQENYSTITPNPRVIGKTAFQTIKQLFTNKFCSQHSYFF